MTSSHESLPPNDLARDAERAGGDCRLRLLAVAGVWLAAVLVAFLLLYLYESVAGPATVTPAVWPADAPIARAANRQTLLMFAHPRCPCTRASLRELEIIQASRPDWGQIQLVLYRPHDWDANWINSDIVRLAKRFRSITIVWDDGGRLAARFGARTSGHVLLYDAQGKLAFSGGITAMRGHEGVNPGRIALMAIGRQEPAATRCTPVFGCPLTAPPHVHSPARSSP